MRTPLETSRFLSDPSVSMVLKDFRVDLTASDVPLLSNGVFVVAEYNLPRNEVFVVKTIMPYVMRRTNLGTPSEDYEMVSPLQANGHVLFTPRVGKSATFLYDVNDNLPAPAASSPSNQQNRTRLGGINMVTEHPYLDALRTIDVPFGSVLVPAGAVFQVTFQLLPSLMPGGFTIGSGVNRLDFAGVYVGGVRLASQYHDELLQEVNTAPGTAGGAR